MSSATAKPKTAAPPLFLRLLLMFPAALFALLLAELFMRVALPGELPKRYPSDPLYHH